MFEAIVFAFRYFWLFASIALILVGDTLFILRSIQDVNETILAYKAQNKNKSFLKGKFTSLIICIICNIILAIAFASLLFYCKEVVDMRHMLNLQ